jgi:basic amino acid/polyamine antiporter, APA family
MSAATPGGGFQQRLGLFDATTLVAGTMIGSGIFIVSADIVRDTGGSGWLLTVWAIAGLMTVLGALAYAELAAMMPHAGGQYVFLREAYSPLFGFLYGWTSFTVIQTGTIAAVAVAFAKFLGVLLPILGTGSEATLFKVDGFHLILKLPLPWLSESLTVFERKEFTITAGQLVGVALILALTLWNTLGINQGRLVQNIFTVAKVGSLVALILIGLLVTYKSDVVRQNFANLWGSGETKSIQDLRKLVPINGELLAWMVAGGALVGALFSSDAWGNVTFVAGEVRNPRRNLALSMILGTGLVIALYLLANVAYLTSLPSQADPAKRAALAQVAHDETQASNAQKALVKSATPTERGIEYARDDRVGTAVMEMAWPGTGTRLMAIAIMISTFGCVNGLILMGARLYYAMANDRLFFRGAGLLNRNKVPGWGLWAQALWSSVLVFSGTYGNLLDYVIFAAVLFYGLTVVGLFVLRFKRPEAERPYRAFGYPILPGLYVSLCAAVMLDLLIVKPIYTWPGLLLVLAGIPVYLVWRLIGKSKS